jgi:hypothetical protein
VFIYSACGIAGSILAQLSVTILSAVLVSQGLKAKGLQTVVPLMVYVQNLSVLLQLLSFFNHLGYIFGGHFFTRLGDAWTKGVGPTGSAGFTAVVAAEVVLAPALPLLMLFSITQAKMMIYVNLKQFVQPALVQRHLYGAIGMTQIISGLVVAAVCGVNLINLWDQLQGVSGMSTVWGIVKGATPSTIETTEAINFMYYVFPPMGVVCAMMGLFYWSVTSFSARAGEGPTPRCEQTRSSLQCDPRPYTPFPLRSECLRN